MEDRRLHQCDGRHGSAARQISCTSSTMLARASASFSRAFRAEAGKHVESHLRVKHSLRNRAGKTAASRPGFPVPRCLLCRVRRQAGKKSKPGVRVPAAQAPRKSKSPRRKASKGPGTGSAALRAPRLPTAMAARHPEPESTVFAPGSAPQPAAQIDHHRAGTPRLHPVRAENRGRSGEKREAHTLETVLVYRLDDRWFPRRLRSAFQPQFLHRAGEFRRPENSIPRARLLQFLAPQGGRPRDGYADCFWGRVHVLAGWKPGDGGAHGRCERDSDAT